MKFKLVTLPIIIAVMGLNLIGCSGHDHAKMNHYEPGLGEIMSLTSMRHAKLWFAGQAENWALAEYELEELEEGFEDAAKFHPTHKEIAQPIQQLITNTMSYPMGELAKAIKAKDIKQFTQSYDTVTEGCNACHQVSKFGFNIVSRPTSNPFTNQAFAPVEN